MRLVISAAAVCGVVALGEMGWAQLGWGVASGLLFAVGILLARRR